MRLLIIGFPAGIAMAGCLLFCCAAASGQREAADQCGQALALGQQMHQRGDYDAAIRQFRAAEAVCPGDPQPALGETQSELAGRRFTSAQQTSTALLKKYPGLPSAEFFLAYSYFMQQKFGLAADVLNKLLAQEPQNEHALRLAGMTQFFLHHLREAENSLRAALKLSPDDGEALYFLGASLMEQGQNDVAARTFHRVLALNPQSFQAYDNLGLCLYGKHEDTKALQYFATSRRLARAQGIKYEAASAHMADTLLDLNRDQQAAEYAREAIALDPQSGRAHYLLGKALERQKQMGAAVAELQIAVRLSPGLAEAHYHLAHIYQRSGKRAEAKRELAAFRKYRKQETSEPSAVSPGNPPN